MISTMIFTFNIFVFLAVVTNVIVIILLSVLLKIFIKDIKSTSGDRTIIVKTPTKVVKVEVAVKEEDIDS